MTEYEIAMLNAARAAGITSREELANFMAQAAHESMGFSRLEESFRYTRSIDQIPVASAFREGRAALDSARLEALQGNPEELGRLMYGGRMGNDDAGDGYRYRGRGFIQLTGEDNYRAAGQDLGLDLLNNPELAADPENARRIALWFWETRLTEAQRNDVIAAGRGINGSGSNPSNGEADRLSRYDQWHDTLTPEFIADLAASRIQPSAGGPQANRNPMSDNMLIRGESGEAVKALQEALRERDYDLPATGNYRDQTYSAVRDFQEKNNLTIDGKAGPETLRALGLEALLQGQSQAPTTTQATTTPVSATTPAQGAQSFDEAMRTMLPPKNGVAPHITSDFGDRTINGRHDDHGGVDFNYVGGQAGINLRHPTVNSPVSGEVVFSGGQYGTVKIRDDQGNSHEILHLQSRSVNVGDRVQAGDSIGTMGGRGPDGANDYAQHVHYQIKDANGRLVNPETFWNQRQVTQTQTQTPSESSSPTLNPPLLEKGSRSEDVRRLQQQLLDLGYVGTDGKAFKTTGYFGDHTDFALRAFQRDREIEVDGKAGPETRRELSEALQESRGQDRSQAGAEVAKIQATVTPEVTTMPLPPQLTIADPKHPQHSLYQQADKALGDQAVHLSPEERQRTVAAIAASAAENQFRKIDGVIMATSMDGQRNWVATEQVVPRTPPFRAYAEAETARTQPVEASTQAAEKAAQEQIERQQQHVQTQSPSFSGPR